MLVVRHAEDLGELGEQELEELYTWIDSIPLSRPKRNIARDFSGACGSPWLLTFCRLTQLAQCQVIFFLCCSYVILLEAGQSLLLE
jgi:hypothetical protein